LLAEAAVHHNTFPGRGAAIRMLGVLRRGSPAVLDALLHALLDVPGNRQAALDAIASLRDVDSALIERLETTLLGPSASAAWAAAQLLAVFGQDARVPPSVRARIIDSLARAIRDPRSRRTVHFSFVDSAIPDMPKLDDVCVDALHRIYRLI
jgi:hypothetical protein